MCACMLYVYRLSLTSGLLWISGAIRGLSIHPSGRLAVSCSDDSTIRIWDMTKGKGIKSIGLEGYKYVPKNTEGAGATGTCLRCILRRTIYAF